MADALSVITLIVAIATALVAMLTYRSQVKMEEIQRLAEKRESDSRKIRANIDIARIEQMVNIVCNWTVNFNITHDLLRAISDWPSEVAALPDGKLKSRSEDVFRQVVISVDSELGSFLRQTTHSSFAQLRNDLPSLIEDYRAMIDEHTAPTT